MPYTYHKLNDTQCVVIGVQDPTNHNPDVYVVEADAATVHSWDVGDNYYGMFKFIPDGVTCRSVSSYFQDEEPYVLADNVLLLDKQEQIVGGELDYPGFKNIQPYTQEHVNKCWEVWINIWGI